MNDTYNYAWTPPDDEDLRHECYLPTEKELEAAKKQIRDANDAALKNSSPRPRYG